MRSRKYLRFPAELTAARQRAGMSQKAAAISLGVDQSYLCAMEKGRRPVPPDELIQRAGNLFRSGTDPTGRLLRAAAHDRVMSLVVELDNARLAAPVISAALMAAGDLSPEELQGLAEYVSTTHSAKKRLLALVPRPSLPVSEEDVTMT